MSWLFSQDRPVRALLLGIAASGIFAVLCPILYHSFPSFDAAAKSVGPKSGPSGYFELSLLLSGPVYLIVYGLFLFCLFLLVVSPALIGMIFWFKAAHNRKRAISLENEAPDA